MIKRQPAFTLTELLITLMLLGVIATFTIPKVLTAQSNARNKAIAKEAAAAVSEAFWQYKMRNPLSPSVSLLNITPFLNYVKLDTITWIDQNPAVAFPFVACSNAGVVCLRLHSGATLFIQAQTSMLNGTAPTNAMEFMIDPDGGYNGTSSVSFWMYSTGRLSTLKYLTPNTCNGFSCYNPDPNGDPGWFTWD